VVVSLFSDRKHDSQSRSNFWPDHATARISHYVIPLFNDYAQCHDNLWDRLYQCFSTFMLQRNLPQMVAFLLGPYAVVQMFILLSVTKPVKQWYCYDHIELWLRISSQGGSVLSGGTPAAPRATLGFRGTPFEKHWLVCCFVWKAETPSPRYIHCYATISEKKHLHSAVRCCEFPLSIYHCPANYRHSRFFQESLF